MSTILYAWGIVELDICCKKPFPPFFSLLCIGYKPFVEACVEAGEKGEALKYIPKLPDPRERAEAYAQIGMAKEAADAASQAKDGELLGRLKMTFSQNAAAAAIFDSLRDRLSFQGIS
ncbi:unnamed protein product [Cuscuta campestris]|uniref:Vps16 C-terminal domain-containing protein n=1 Tax=Cuscuta campestris TaxID=132261 RepID=A0A484LRE9_9ASTE|nr:unnamed protein product [Cuscuta campestris]